MRGSVRRRQAYSHLSQRDNRRDFHRRHSSLRILQRCVVIHLYKVFEATKSTGTGLSWGEASLLSFLREACPVFLDDLLQVV